MTRKEEGERNEAEIEIDISRLRSRKMMSVISVIELIEEMFQYAKMDGGRGDDEAVVK